MEQWDLETGLQLFTSQQQTGTDRPGTDSTDQVQGVQNGAVRSGDWAPALYIPATDRPGTDSTDQVQGVQNGAVGSRDWAPALYIPATDRHRQARYRQYRSSTGCTEWSSEIWRLGSSSLHPSNRQAQTGQVQTVQTKYR
jgi:hypothetical protein